MARPAHPPELREAAARLLRETDRTLASIGAEVGVAKNTIGTWSRRFGWRLPTYAKAPVLAPALWPEARRAALARLYQNPAVDPDDLAAALGASRRGGRSLFKACGLGPRRVRRRGLPPVRAEAGRTGDGPSLRAALRGHVARQIALFDAGLDAALRGEAPGATDSARVLRDLGGLKRILDELDAAGGGHAGGGLAGGGLAGGAAADEPQSALAALDLPALRASIARRYAAFAGERPDAGLPGEPAGPAAGGAGA
ncbi:hypothetical protein [Methylobacterium nigriterrae]|uniref:hypothetical protein n=1 Tax=Methylobacterium nigriterrae TaxID=3127512 RepID=UPI003013AD45